MVKPENFVTAERAELVPGAEETMDKILNYCDEKILMFYLWYARM